MNCASNDRIEGAKRYDSSRGSPRERAWPHNVERYTLSNFSRFGQFQCILYVNAEIPDGVQRALGYSPLLAGIAHMPLTATVFCISQFLSPLITRFGSRVLLASGSTLVAIDLIGLALLTEGDGYLPAIPLSRS